MNDKDLAKLLENVKELLGEEILKNSIVTYSVNWENLKLKYEGYNCSANAEFNKEEYTIEEILNMTIERLNK